MEPVSFTEMLKQFGPYGICLFLMGSGLVYFTRWLREEQTRAMNERKETHNEFLNEREKKGARHERIMVYTVDKFTIALKEHSTVINGSLEKHGNKIEELVDRVDKLDDHMRNRHQVWMANQDE